MISDKSAKASRKSVSKVFHGRKVWCPIATPWLTARAINYGCLIEYNSSQEAVEGEKSHGTQVKIVDFLIFQFSSFEEGFKMF